MPMTEVELYAILKNVFRFTIHEIVDYDNPELLTNELGIHFETGTFFIKKPDGTIFKPNEASITLQTLAANKYDYENDLLTSDIYGGIEYLKDITDIKTLITTYETRYSDVYDGMKDESIITQIVTPGDNLSNFLNSTSGGLVTIKRLGDDLYISLNTIKNETFINVYHRTSNTIERWIDNSEINKILDEIYRSTKYNIISTTQNQLMGSGDNLDVRSENFISPIIDMTLKAKDSDILNGILLIKESGVIIKKLFVPNLYKMGDVYDTYNISSGIIDRKFKIHDLKNVVKTDLVTNTIYKILDDIGTITDYGFNNIALYTSEASRDTVAAQNKLYKGSDNALYFVVPLNGTISGYIKERYLVDSNKIKTNGISLMYNKNYTISLVAGNYHKNLIPNSLGVLELFKDSTEIVTVVDVSYFTNEGKNSVNDFTIGADNKSLEGLDSSLRYNILTNITGANPTFTLNYNILKYKTGFLSPIIELILKDLYSIENGLSEDLTLVRTFTTGTQTGQMRILESTEELFTEMYGEFILEYKSKTSDKSGRYIFNVMVNNGSYKDIAIDNISEFSSPGFDGLRVYMNQADLTKKVYIDINKSVPEEFDITITHNNKINNIDIASEYLLETVISNYTAVKNVDLINISTSKTIKAGGFIGDLQGNSSSSSKWITARTLSLTGDATGSVSIDGSGNVSLAVTVVDDLHAHVISNIDGLQAALDAKLLATANAVSASKWATARTITLTGDATGSISIDGSSNVNLNVSVVDNSHNHTNYVEKAGSTLTGSMLFGGANFQGIYWGSKYEDDVTHSGSWSYIRQDPSHGPGYMEIGVDATLNIYETDGRTLAVSIDASAKTLDAIGGLKENGTALVSKYLGISANAVSASKWATARTITLSGDASGSVSVDGSSNVSLSVAITDDSHNHTNYVEKAGSTLTGSMLFGGANFQGIYWGSKYEDDAAHEDAWSYIRQDPSRGPGYMEIGVDASLNIYETDGRTLAVSIDANAKTLDAIGGLKENGTALANKYLGISANAVSASKWATARTITLSGDASGSVSIDGSSNVSLSVAITDDSHNHIISNIDNLQAELDARVLTSDVVATPSPNKILKLNASSELPANITGNSATTTKWATARTLSLTGDATGSVSIDGSGNVSLAVTVVDDLHAHVISNIDGLQAALDAKLLATANAVSASKWATARTITLSGDTSGSVSIDGSTNVTLSITVNDDSHNHIISNIDGLQAELDAKLLATANAVSASKWATARTITLTGAVTGSVSIDGSGNVSLATTYKNSGVTAGTYTKLTVDAKGMVTSGTTLSSTDIPNLDWSKITSGKPTTLSGYGITDALGLGGGLLSGDLSINAGSSTTPLSILISAEVDASIFMGQSSYGFNLTYLGTGTGNANGLRLSSTNNGSPNTLFESNQDGIVNFPSGLKKGGTNVSVEGHIHTIANVTDLQTTLNNKLGLTANAVSASKWATARTITLSGDTSGSVSIDGSANVTLSVTVKDDSHNHVISNIDGLQAALDAKLLATANAVSASKWATARTLSLTGDATGSVSIDGSGNVSLAVTVVDDLHAHIISNIDGLQAALDAKFNSSGGTIDGGVNTIVNIISDDTGESVLNLYGNLQGTGRVFVGQDLSYGGGFEYNGDNTPASTGAGSDYFNLYKVHDGVKFWTARNNVGSRDWEFAATVTASNLVSTSTISEGGALLSAKYLGLTANAVSASKWATARTLSLTGDATGSVSIDGSGNVSLSVTVVDDLHAHVISNIDGLQAALDAKALATNVYTKAEIDVKTNQNLKTTDDVEFNSVNIGGYVMKVVDDVFGVYLE